MDSNTENQIPSTLAGVHDALCEVFDSFAAGEKLERGGKRGGFVKAQDLERFSVLLDKLEEFEGSNSVNVKKYSDAYAQEMARNKELLETLHQAEDFAANAKKDLSKAHDDLEEAEKKFEAAMEKTNHYDMTKVSAAQKAAEAKIKELEAERTKLQEQHSFDADKATSLAKTLDETRVEANTLRLEKAHLSKEYQAACRERAAASKSVRDLSAKVSALQKDVNSTMGEVSEILQDPNINDWLNVNARPVNWKGTKLQRLLGPYGERILRELDFTSHQRLKEKTLKLRQTVNKAKPAALQGARDVLSIIWKWMKTAKTSDLPLALPILQLIVGDLWAGLARSSQFYTSVLRENINVTLESYAKAEKKINEETSQKESKSWSGFFARGRRKLNNFWAHCKILFTKSKPKTSLWDKIITFRDSTFNHIIEVFGHKRASKQQEERAKPVQVETESEGEENDDENLSHEDRPVPETSASAPVQQQTSVPLMSTIVKEGRPHDEKHKHTRSTSSQRSIFGLRLGGSVGR